MVALLVCAPYLALLVPYRYSMAVQLAAILGVLAAAAFVGARRWAGGVASLPRAVGIGLALYAGAAIWGLAIGFVAGNPLRYVLSQGVSMLLLPVATLVFLPIPRFDSRALVKGLSGAAIFAAALHVVALLSPALRSKWAAGSFRFVFVQGATATGAAALLVLVLLGATLSRPSWLTSAGLVAAVTLLVGSLSRGAWLSAGVGAIVLFALAVKDRKVAWRMGILGASLILMVALLVVLGLKRQELVGQIDSHDLLSAGLQSKSGHGATLRSSSERGAEELLFSPLPFGGAALRIEIRGRLEAPAHGNIAVQWLGDGGNVVGKHRVNWKAGPGPCRLDGTMVREPGSVAARVSVRLARGSGALTVEGVRALGFSSPIEFWTWSLIRRVSVSFQDLQQGIEVPTIAYRARETRAVLRVWKTSSIGRDLIGQGLGKTFEFHNSAWSATGRRTSLSRASYIHNFYLFLAFKLGLAGLAALWGLEMILAWTFRRALAERQSGSHAWLLAACVSAWLAYLIWSVTSPEIYDFRMAPIWGVMIVACVNTELNGPSGSTEGA